MLLWKLSSDQQPGEQEKVVEVKSGLSHTPSAACAKAPAVLACADTHTLC